MNISIVTPLYNQCEYVEEAIQSVMNQAVEGTEHIIIDGESTDGSLEVLKRYPHLRWISEPDEGQSDAINKGFDMATGDIIGWLNADDYYFPGVFEYVLNYFETHDVDVLYANLEFVNSSGEHVGKLVSHRPVKWISLFNCYVPSASLFIRRKLLDDGIRIDKLFNITMDKELIAHALYAGYTLAHTNKYFAAFRWHDSNKSLNTKEVKLETAMEGLKILNRYSPLNIPINNITAFFYRRFALCTNAFRKILRRKPDETL